MKNKKIFNAILAIFVFANTGCFAQTPVCGSTGCDYTIDWDVGIWDGASVSDGETICIEGNPGNGIRNELIIKNLLGTANSKIIVMPCSDLVTFIPGATNVKFCINFENCKYFILTGDGIENQKYGIKLLLNDNINVDNGIKFGPYCKEYNINNIEISNKKDTKYL
ncbi:MAG: hypothetical protein U9R19_04090 [Bacteroidota bacterium]|nr:hypothetical protein [Bacteroidota bacterium]